MYANILCFLACLLTVVAAERMCSRVRTRGEELVGRAYTDVDEVYERVYIGNVCFAADPIRLHNEGITHIVPAAQEIGRLHPDLFHYHSMDSPLKDGNDANLQYWRHAARFINDTLGNDVNARVLVHCNMGISRSTCVVLVYLMIYQNFCIEDAFAILKERRAGVEPNPFYWEKLLHYF